MADRNIGTLRHYKVYTTREGMMLYIPPDGVFSKHRFPASVDPHEETVDQRFPLGTRLEYGERVFRYFKLGATAVTAGKLVQQTVPLAGHIDEAIDEPAVGTTTINFTGAATPTDDVAKDDLANGYLYVNDESGEGHIYRIKGNDALTGGTAGKIFLMDPIAKLPAAAATGTILYPQYFKLIVHPSPPTAKVMGWTVRDMTASYFGWLQVSGPVAALIDGTVVIADEVIPSDAVDGAVEPRNFTLTEGAPNTLDGTQELRAVGEVIAVNANTEYGAIWAHLE